jgi:hypothetical protein
VQAQLQSAGIIGNRVVDAMPRGARLEDVWVQTSTRKGELSVQAETSGMTADKSCLESARSRQRGAKPSRNGRRSRKLKP